MIPGTYYMYIVSRQDIQYYNSFQVGYTPALYVYIVIHSFYSFQPVFLISSKNSMQNIEVKITPSNNNKTTTVILKNQRAKYDFYPGIYQGDLQAGYSVRSMNLHQQEIFIHLNNTGKKTRNIILGIIKPYFLTKRVYACNYQKSKEPGFMVVNAPLQK